MKRNHENVRVAIIWQIPHSDEIRHPSVKEDKATLAHNPNCSVANSFRAIARKIIGKETDVVKQKRKAVF